MSDVQPQWYMRAACRGTNDPDAWYVGANNPADRTRLRKAKRTCAVCPVIAECGRYAEETKQPYGVWGGLRRNLHGEKSGHTEMMRGRHDEIRRG